MKTACRTTTLSPCLARWCASATRRSCSTTEGSDPRLAAQEREEIDIIQEFLPKQLDESEIGEAVKDAIVRLDANRLKDMGPIMAELRGRFAGRMDFGRASQIVKEQLS